MKNIHYNNKGYKLMVEFSSYFENFHNVHVLCIGDIMLDHFMYGDVHRISPEGPIPVLRIRREKDMLGGVGNVAANLAALGTRTSVLAVVGDDNSASSIRAKLQDIRISDSGLLTDKTRPTSLKTRFISGGQQLLRTDREETSFLNEEYRQNLFQKIYHMIDEVDIVSLSDYGKGVLNSDIFSYIMATGKPVIVDPKGRDYSLYKGAYLVTPNKKELAEASGMPTNTDAEVVSAATHLIDTCGIKNILVTRSKDGMSIIYKDQEPCHIKTDVLEVYDVSGAGDTVVASMAAMLAAGANLAEAAEIANIAGGIVVGKVGTAVVSAEDLIKYVAKSKIEEAATSRKNAVEESERWQQNGMKVGFTNGCFDLLHPGHISLLKQAKARCDRLIVGLNTDASIKRLKGEGRPVQDEISRAMVLKALETVDMVVLFDEDTPIELLHELKPDVLVKGGDYALDQVVGADYVVSYGGEVFLSTMEEGQSTTGMIARSVVS